MHAQVGGEWFTQTPGHCDSLKTLGVRRYRRVRGMFSCRLAAFVAFNTFGYSRAQVLAAGAVGGVVLGRNEGDAPGLGKNSNEDDTEQHADQEDRVQGLKGEEKGENVTSLLEPQLRQYFACVPSFSAPSSTAQVDTNRQVLGAPCNVM